MDSLPEIRNYRNRYRVYGTDIKLYRTGEIFRYLSSTEIANTEYYKS